MNPNPRTISTGKPAPFDKNLLVEIREGDAGTDDTIAAMIAVAQYAAEKDAAALLAIFPHPRTPMGLYDALRQNVTFKDDPARIELVPSAAQMLAAIQARGKHRGDCDDRATLGLAMILAHMKHVRIAARDESAWSPCVIVCGLDPHGDFQHVYCGHLRRGTELVQLGDFHDADDLGLWVFGIDPQEGTPPGQHPAAARYRVYPVKQNGL